jgi:hypothetical protein
MLIMLSLRQSGQLPRKMRGAGGRVAERGRRRRRDMNRGTGGGIRVLFLGLEEIRQKGVKMMRAREDWLLSFPSQCMEECKFCGMRSKI